jgi:hypothetical protein
LLTNESQILVEKIDSLPYASTYFEDVRILRFSVLGQIMEKVLVSDFVLFHDAKIYTQLDSLKCVRRQHAAVDQCQDLPRREAKTTPPRPHPLDFHFAMPTTVPSIYSSAMLFDFEPFLSAIDPLQRYEIQPLTGGLVNVTVRATKVSGHSSGLFPAHGSLILKYAPPFVAAIGESAPFSQDRQVRFFKSPTV